MRPEGAPAHPQTSLRTRSATSSGMMSSPSQLRDCETPELDMSDFASQNTELLRHARPQHSHCTRTTAAQGSRLRGPSHAWLGACSTPQDAQGGSMVRLAPPTFPPTATTSVTQPELRAPPPFTTAPRVVAELTDSHTRRPQHRGCAPLRPSVRTRPNRALGASCDRILTDSRDAASTGCWRAARSHALSTMPVPPAVPTAWCACVLGLETCEPHRS